MRRWVTPDGYRLGRGDRKEQAKPEGGDLAEPVERGVLDWLEVHELSSVVGETVTGRLMRSRNT